MGSGTGRPSSGIPDQRSDVMIRRFAITIVMTVAMTLGAIASPSIAAAEGGHNNIVVVKNSTDATTNARSGLAVSEAPGDTVDNQNVAYANSHDCTGCGAVAVAMQVIVVEGNPHDFEPANAAVAVNTNCISCHSFAFAFQYVVQPGDDVHLDGDAHRQLHDLRERVAQVAEADLSHDDMKAQLQPLFDELVKIVNDNLRASGHRVDGAASEDDRAA
jgi:hypothetical protein